MNAETPVFRPAPVTPCLPLAEQRWRGAWRGGLRAAYATATGSSHSRNEDCCSHVPSADGPRFCGVADGVGGGAHGEIASSVLLNHCASAPRDIWSNPAQLAAWLRRADAEVRKAIARRSDQPGAATLAGAWFASPGTAYVLNVGDCRAYQLKPPARPAYAIQRLTMDQTYASLAQEPPPNGKPDDPARMVGAGAVGTPPVVKAQLAEGDLLLLCSDGVHKFVADEQIAAIVSAGLGARNSLEQVCTRLVEAAKANGGRDDASALLVMRRPRVLLRWIFGCAAVALLVLGLLAGAQIASAETQSVIDPTELPQAPPPATPKAGSPAPGAAARGDAAPKRDRRAEDAEQRKRAKAAARAAEQARQEATAREVAAKAAAAKEAAAREAARRAAAARAAATRATAAKATNAKIAAQKQAAAEEEATRRAALHEAERELEARQAAREAAAREAREAREAALKEAAARQAALETEARQAAAREASRQAAREAATAKLIGSRLPRAPRQPPRFGTVFRDCAECPELVWLPEGEFVSTAGPGPTRSVIDYMLAVGRFEVTFAEWDACVAARGCRRPHDSGWGRGRQPVIDVSWEDARQYTAWMSRRTGKTYRLLTEAEWEYAARAGTDARYWWGDEARAGAANCNDCGTRWDGQRPAPVGSFAPNPFGLHDMHGNVWEWVQDCSYDCVSRDTRIIRGGAWHAPARAMRSAARANVTPGFHDNRIGFRVARLD